MYRKKFMMTSTHIIGHSTSTSENGQVFMVKTKYAGKQGPDGYSYCTVTPSDL